MNKKKSFGFGIIGAGMISSFHARSVAELDGAELVAVSGRSRERAEKLAKDFNVPFYLDYREMLKRDDIDIVNICTPSGMHMEPTLAAAESGKHVIVEKPVEITLERADRMIEACNRAGVKLAVIFQNRFNKGATLLREAVNDGIMGRLVLGDAYVKWYRNQEYYDSVDWRGTLEGDGGAALINQSIHTIDLLQWIMGPVESIFGRIGTFTHDIEGEDTGLAILTFKNGAMGVIEGSTSTYPGFPERLEIHGEKGTIILEGGSVKTWEIEGIEDKPADLVEGPKAVGASSPMAISIDAHKAQIADMIDAVKNDRAPLVDGEEAKKSLQIVRSIYQSSKTGKIVTL
jgi:predicted dehydrogenase